MVLDFKQRARRRHLAMAAAAVLLLAVIVAAAAAAGAALAAIAIDAARVKTAAAIESQLRACEDPNDPRFSNARGEAFDNAIVLLVTDERGKTGRDYGRPQRRSSIRRTPLADECDSVTPVSASPKRAALTRPY